MTGHLRAEGSNGVQQQLPCPLEVAGDQVQQGIVHLQAKGAHPGAEQSLLGLTALWQDVDWGRRSKHKLRGDLMTLNKDASAGKT